MTPIDCRTALTLRDDYLHGRRPVGVEAHLTACSACLDKFVESALAMGPSIQPPVGFTTAATPDFSAAMVSTRRAAIVGASGVIGLGCAWMASVVFVPDGAALHFAAPGVLVVAVTMMMEFAVLLMVPGIVRAT